MRNNRFLMVACGILLGAISLCAPGKTTPMRPGAAQARLPCEGSDGGVVTCPPAPRAIAVRAGRMFDSNTGQS